MSKSEQLKDSAYMRLLAYAAERTGKPFTEAEAINSTKVLATSFPNYIGLLYVEDPPGSRTYSVTVDALPKYIEYVEFEEARATARRAQAEASSARKVAIASIAISAGLAGLQVILQVFGATRLDQAQVQQFEAAASSIPTAIASTQSPKLDAVASKLDEANRNLAAISASQAELLKQAKQGGRPAR